MNCDYDLARHSVKIRGMMPHPAVVILLWIFLAIAMQFLSGKELLFVGVPLLVAAWVLAAARLFTLLRRTRWILLSLFLVYAYATPGEAVWPSLAGFSPTIEGVTSGATQLSRLIFTLAGLALLLNLMSQPQLISGLYSLAYPLCFAGVSRARLAVRLALTLRYAESSLMDNAVTWRENMERVLAQVDVRQHSIELQATPFALLDGLLVVLGCALLLLVML